MYSFILHTSRLRAWIKREEVKLKVCISQYYLSNYECTGRQSGMLFITICCLLVSVVFQLVFHFPVPQDFTDLGNTIPGPTRSIQQGPLARGKSSGSEQRQRQTFPHGVMSQPHLDPQSIHTIWVYLRSLSSCREVVLLCIKPSINSNC